MKKKTFLLLLLSLTIVSLPVFSQDAGELARKCVQALGGEEAVRSYVNFSASGTAKVKSYREMNGTVKIVRQGKKSWTRTDLDFGSSRKYTIVEAYDGKIAWSQRRSSVTDKPALNYESDSGHTVLVLLGKQAVFSMARETEIGGRKAVGIEADVKGKKTLFFLDKENYTILEIVYKDTYFGDKDTKEVLEKRIRYGDYKKFGSVLFPTRNVFYEKGKKQKEYRFEEVTFKSKTADSFFRRPVKKPDLRYYAERMH
ncbi:MAG: hypothetical protein KAW12_20600 [Candidatus Aminicenantes bacterium]|nr:hypothetical protein [Candidatus Aminicenantes bacterium]